MEAGSHLAKQPIPGQEPREVGGSYKQEGLMLHDGINILHTCITQKHLFLPLSEIKSGTDGHRKKRKNYNIQGKQIILAISLEVVSSLMNFNAGYQLESKQFQRNRGALQR